MSEISITVLGGFKLGSVVKAARCLTKASIVILPSNSEHLKKVIRDDEVNHGKIDVFVRLQAGSHRRFRG